MWAGRIKGLIAVIIPGCAQAGALTDKQIN